MEIASTADQGPAPSIQPAAPLDGRAWRVPWLRRFALPAILLLATLLRWHGLTDEGLWYDEALSVSIAVSEPGDIIPLVRRFEQVPPLYHLMLAGWIRLFGQSEVAVRLPSVIAGVLAVWGGFRLGHRLFGFAGAVAAGLLMSASPFQIFYSQETRTYMLMLALSVWSCEFYLDLTSGERRTRVLVGYALVTAALLYSHLYGGMVILAQNLHWLGLLTRRAEPRIGAVRWLTLQAIVALLFAPWVPTMWRWTRSVSQSFWILPFDLNEVTRSLWIYAGSALAMLILVCLAVVGVARARKERGVWLVVLLIITCVIVPVVLSMLLRPMFTQRYGMPASAALLILAAGGIAAMKYAWPQALALALLIGLPLSGWDRYRATFVYDNVRQDWRSAAAHLGKHMRRGDYVAINPAQGIMAYGYYQPRQDVEEIAFVDLVIPIDTPMRPKAHVWLVVHAGKPAGPIIAGGKWQIRSHKFVQGVEIYELAPPG